MLKSARNLAKASSTASTGPGGSAALRRSAFALLPAAQEFILAQEDGKARLLQAVADLSKAYALAVPSRRSSRAFATM